ncbi:MAG: hypothetical protein WCZ27_10535 [Tissierellaceae bacterium]
MKRIVIRTLAGKDIGFGHFYRCLSLASALKMTSDDIRITFIINTALVDLIKVSDLDYIVSDLLEGDISIVEGLNPDLFIFDSYLGDDYYLKSIKGQTKLMLIDDNNDIYDSSIADIIYNGNLHGEALGYRYVDNQIRLIGPKYLIMKEEYWNRGKPRTEGHGILITTGGTDRYKLALNILQWIGDMDLKIRVIIGPGYEADYIGEIEDRIGPNTELIHRPNSLKNYINTSGLVVTAGGSTVYEVLSQGKTPIVFSIADNQDILCRELAKRGVPYLGKYPDIDYHKLASIIKDIGSIDPYPSKELFDLIDRQGALIVARAIFNSI